MRILLFATVFTLYTGALFSQATSVNYTFSNSTTASLTSMTGATDIIIPSSTTGDFSSAIYPIGFDFWLMGVRQANFSVNSNGLMRLGKTIVTTSFTNTAANAATNTPSLFAFWDDLNSYTTSATSRVRYIVTGSAPNRILTVEWKDFIISYNAAGSTQLSTFQVRLYETTGVFEFVYGRMQVATGSSTVTASAGMVYANSNNNLIYLTSVSTPAVLRTSGGFVTTLVNSAAPGNITGLNSSTNGSRTLYKFTPPIPNANPTGLGFSAVGTSGMTLTWACAATNEVGYAIYRSDDLGITYNFVSQTGVNVTTSVQTALSPSTNYFWKVYAVTEGGLSTALSGSQATTACGAPVTNTMAITAAGTYTWNTAANWSLGHVPTACENAVITFTRSANGNATAIVNQNVPATVNNLTVNGIYNGTGNKILQLQTNSNALTVVGSLSTSSSGGSGANSSVDIVANTGSVITLKGNATIGQPADTKATYLGVATGTDPDFYIKGNLTFNNRSSAGGGTYHFDGGVSQTLTDANTASSFIVGFGNAEVGTLTATNLTVTGPEVTFVDNGNISVNSGSSLVLPYDAAFNQFTAGTGALVLKANATMKLGDYFGGQTGSNFPLDFGSFSIDPASTVEYNYDIVHGVASPVIFTDVDYGNLVLSNNSRKYLDATLFVDGNFTNNTGSTFGCDEATIFNGASFVNNGTVDGLYANSEFGFYGIVAQSYSGTGTFGTLATPFGGWGMDLYNPANVTLGAAMYTNRVNLFTGGFINSNNIKIGTSSFGLVQRGGDAASPAGSFDTYPVINSPANYYLRYDDASVLTTTGPEIPISTNTFNTVSNNINGVTLSANLTATNDFQVSQNTFDMGSNTVKIGNTITKTAGVINGSSGTVEMTGTGTQTIPASLFTGNNLKNLVISNTNTGTGVTLAGTLDIYNSLTFGAGGRKLTTANFLTLKSTATGTAWVGPMVSTNFIIDSATVERYIPTHSKAWQFLSTPITANSTQTVKKAWQEGASTANGNPNPGFGTMLIGVGAGAATQPTPGFDASAATASIKVFDSTGVYIPLNRTDTAISNPRGYMVFVRGPRSITTSVPVAPTTVMRMKGTLHTPANPPATITLTRTGFAAAGNPYASAIDFRQVTLTGGIQPDFFYMWDPKLTTTTGPGANSLYGVGGIQSFSWNPFTMVFDVSPGGGSYSGTNRYIESGQAFFVNAPASVGTISFTESCKVGNSNDVNRTMPQASAIKIKQLRTNLHVITGAGKVLLDGNLVQFAETWSNSVDINDGIKMNNSGENFGIMKEGKLLAVERRKPVIQTDTIFYNIGQMKSQQYMLEFMPDQLVQPGLHARLEDRYLHTNTAVSLEDTTRIFFNIGNAAGSFASNRFRLVFGKAKNPVKDSKLIVDNKTTGKDVQAQISGKKKIAGISVYPNPVENKIVQVKFISQPLGDYTISILNKLGQMIYNTSVDLESNDFVKSIQLSDATTPGTYQLSVISDKGAKTIQQIIIR